jgi:hypothetical protein
VSTTDLPPSREWHSPAQLVGRLHPPWTKLNAIDGEHNSPFPGWGVVTCWFNLPKSGGGEHTELKPWDCGWAGHKAELPHLAGGGAHLSEPKLVVWAEKWVNIELNSNLSCGQKGLPTAPNQRPGQITSEILPAPESPAHWGSTGSKHPELTPLKVVQQGEPTSIATQPSIPTLRRGKDTEKAPVKWANAWISSQRSKSRCFFLFFYLAFLITTLPHLYSYFLYCLSFLLCYNLVFSLFCSLSVQISICLAFYCPTFLSPPN